MTDASERESFQSALLEHLPEGVLVCGPDGHVLAANRLTQHLLGIGADEIVGRSAADPGWALLCSDGTILSAKDHPVQRAMAHKLPVTNVLVGFPGRRSGEVRWAEISAFPEVRSDGSIRHQSGGRIGLASEVSNGTTFTILLPAAEEGIVEKAGTEPAAAEGRGELILVVEDEPALRRLAVIMLEKLGYRTVGAENGGAALMLVEEEGLRPDLVVTDVVMPGIRGGVLVERLRKTMPDVRVIYMSGYTDDAIVSEEAGVSAQFLQKPFSMASLTAAIGEALAGG